MSPTDGVALPTDKASIAKSVYVVPSIEYCTTSGLTSSNAPSSFNITFKRTFTSSSKSKEGVIKYLDDVRYILMLYPLFLSAAVAPITISVLASISDMLPSNISPEKPANIKLIFPLAIGQLKSKSVEGPCTVLVAKIFDSSRSVPEVV